LYQALVEHELLTLPEHLSSPPVFGGSRVTRSLVLYVCFVDRCLSFCPLSFGLCLVCSSSIYGFWWYNEDFFKILDLYKIIYYYLFRCRISILIIVLQELFRIHLLSLDEVNVWIYLLLKKKERRYSLNSEVRSEYDCFFQKSQYFKEIFIVSGTSGAWTAYPSGASEFTPGFRWGSCYSIFSFICMFCWSLFVLLSFFFWPLSCLFFFDIRILIAP
jgi:hypothetical protein